MQSARISRKTNNLLRDWHVLFNLTILSAWFYAAVEWLFFMTRPSPLSILASLDSVRVLAVTAGAVALISIGLLAILSLPAFPASNANWRSRLLNIGAIVPALLLSVTALIMLDNFTSTEFEFGIVTAKGFLRSMYALGFLFFCWQMIRFARRAIWARRKPISYLALGLLAISIAGILVTRLARYPNIIILGADGLSASYLTAYDPTQKATPFMGKLAQTSLIAENAFPNAGSTTGSTTTVLTGKETMETRVYRFSDSLTGRDSLEHLPGILRQHDYKTVEIGTPDYVDARQINLLEGFEIVNNQSMMKPDTDGFGTSLGKFFSTRFIHTIAERATQRLLHIFFIKDMQVSSPEIGSPRVPISDEERVDQIIALLEHARGPLFIFAHLMDTHGPDFSFQKQVFSSGANVAEEWDEHRYQDALLSFDGHVKRIYEYLNGTGQLDRTILVIYTDHGFRYATHERIPVILHFPENARAGTRKNNVQNIDIPATLLDYLGIPIPTWMSGTSILDGEAPADRAMLSTTTGSPAEIAPPFHQINIVQVIVCHKWYALNVRKKTFDNGEIAGHTSKCDQNILPSEEQIRQSILESLETHGYDIRSLEE